MISNRVIDPGENVHLKDGCMVLPEAQHGVQIKASLSSTRRWVDAEGRTHLTWNTGAETHHSVVRHVSSTCRPPARWTRSFDSAEQKAGVVWYPVLVTDTVEVKPKLVALWDPGTER